MSERDPDYILEEEEDDGEELKGLTNHQLAENYACSIDEVMVDFKDLIAKDKDTLCHNSG